MATRAQSHPRLLQLLREYEDTLWAQSSQAISERNLDRVATISAKLREIESEFKANGYDEHSIPETTSATHTAVIARQPPTVLGASSSLQGPPTVRNHSEIRDPVQQARESQRLIGTPSARTGSPQDTAKPSAALVETITVRSRTASPFATHAASTGKAATHSKLNGFSPDYSHAARKDDVVELSSSPLPELDQESSISGGRVIPFAYTADVERFEKRRPTASFPDPELACPGTKYTHLIKVEFENRQLTCYICGATGPNGTKYFANLNGYYRHLTKKHFETDANRTRKQVLAEAMKRDSLPIVDADDINRIKKGREPLHIKPPFDGKKPASTPTATDRSATPSGIISTRSAVKDSRQQSEDCLHYDHDRYPHLVTIGGKAYIISCHICGATVSTSKGNTFGKYWNGIPGLRSHIAKAHSSHHTVTGALFSSQKCAQLCGKKEVPPADVRSIALGAEPEEPIVKMAGFDMTLTQYEEGPPSYPLSVLDTRLTAASSRAPADGHAQRKEMARGAYPDNHKDIALIPPGMVAKRGMNQRTDRDMDTDDDDRPLSKRRTFARVPVASRAESNQL